MITDVPPSLTYQFKNERFAFTPQSEAAETADDEEKGSDADHRVDWGRDYGVVHGGRADRTERDWINGQPYPNTE